MLHLSPVAVEIRNDLIIKSASVDDALSRACNDIYWRELRMMELEKELRRVWLLVSGGYAQLHPNHPARQPKPQMQDAITDDWVKTGIETEHS